MKNVNLKYIGGVVDKSLSVWMYVKITSKLICKTSPQIIQIKNIPTIEFIIF